MSSPPSPNPSELPWTPLCSEGSASQALSRFESGKPLVTDRYFLEPAAILSDAGKPPDRWQRELLEGQPRGTLLLCSRQSGPSLLCAGQSRRPSSLGRRVQAKNGASVWNAGGGI